MEKLIHEFLVDSRSREIVERVIEAMEGGLVTPAVVAFANAVLPPELQDLRPLLLDLAAGTHRARGLGKAQPGWVYTLRMAEQCTHPMISTHHATRFVGCKDVIEICTGAGHDALALSTVVRSVRTYESDSRVAAITASNLAVSGILNVEIVVRPWTITEVCGEHVSGVWADPSRRSTTGRRTRSIEDHEPSVHDILQWVQQAVTPIKLGIKVGPADEIPASILDATSSELIGFGRECRERVLWVGTTLPPVLVTLVDKASVWAPTAGDPSEFLSDASAPEYLIEPHPAVIASGKIEEFFHEVGAQPIDPMIAYGVLAMAPDPSPLYDVFKVVKMDRGVSEKKIRKRLRDLQWGNRTEFKKRGWGGDPESLRVLIPDDSFASFGTVIIARRDPGHVTIYAQRVL